MSDREDIGGDLIDRTPVRAQPLSRRTESVRPPVPVRMQAPSFVSDSESAEILIYT